MVKWHGAWRGPSASCHQIVCIRVWDKVTDLASSMDAREVTTRLKQCMRIYFESTKRAFSLTRISSRSNAVERSQMRGTVSEI